MADFRHTKLYSECRLRGLFSLSRTKRSLKFKLLIVTAIWRYLLLTSRANLNLNEVKLTEIQNKEKQIHKSFNIFLWLYILLRISEIFQQDVYCFFKIKILAFKLSQRDKLISSLNIHTKIV
jgi:hypothetical protein